MNIFEQVKQIVAEMKPCGDCGELCLPDDEERGICHRCETEGNLASAYCNDDIDGIRKYEKELEEMGAYEQS